MSSTIFVIAAILGCWQWESGVNPGIWESLSPQTWDFQYSNHKGGYGLGQWTNYGTQYGRLYNLHNYLSGNGYADDSGEGEVAFFINEAYWSGTSDKYGYTSLSQFLSSGETDINDLVWDFLQCWEGVSGDNYATRCSYASSWLSYLQQSGTETATWSAGNNYLSTSQMRANGRLIYQILGGYIPESAQHTITVTASEGGTAAADRTSAAAGVSVKLSYTANDGYYLSAWDVQAGGVTISNDAFIMGPEDVTILAQFTAGEAPEPQEDDTAFVIAFMMGRQKHINGGTIII